MTDTHEDVDRDLMEGTWADLVHDALRVGGLVQSLDEVTSAATDGMTVEWVDQLAEVWHILYSAHRALGELCTALKRSIGETGARQVTVDGDTWQVRPRWREDWDTTALLAAVVARADEDGLDPVGAVRDVWNLGRPRTTALKHDLRLLPEDFCEKSQQGWDLVKKTTGGAK